MKYAISLVVGIVIGAILFAMGLFYNPFTTQQAISPLAVTNERIIDLAFSAVPGDAILFTNNGESTIAPHPARVADLWEPAIADTSVFVTTLVDSRGEMVGIGIKTSTLSEGTKILTGKALVNSAWHVYVPGQGTLLIDQSENFWTYLREIVIPARWSSGDNWKGSFHGITTSGPGALGTARVSGGSGIFAGLNSEAVESLTAKAYSAVDGPVSMIGNLTVTIPAVSSQIEPD
jgi:hypothetical protein